jgi:leucyl aminopeptidase
MPDHLLEQPTVTATALIPVAEAEYAAWRERQPPAWQAWLDRAGFRAKRGSLCLIPGANGELAAVVTGIDPEDAPWQLAGLPTTLPAGDYQLVADWDSATRAGAALGWLLGGYRFDRYKETPPLEARLAITDIGDPDAVRARAAAIALTRDLINTPAQDLLPEQLAEAARDLAGEFGAEFRQRVGEELLRDNFPVIHAVGRASSSAPRLIELRWGRTDHPPVTLVGKGVCFDSGGLDLKPASGMRLMKKDMGGAAHVLGLARLIMATGLPVRLRVLIPAVENAVSGNAFRPGDVLRSRKGLSIEVDNTDAEGRLILCDALTAAVEERPELILDFATLTGATRVAVGTEIAAFFCNDPTLAAGLTAAADTVRDPIWRLPLHQPYRELLDSKVADIVNSSSNGFAGASTAALFLREFVPDDLPWAHFDIMAWNTRARPGRPEGGEAMGLRAAFDYLERRFGTRK